tara:strand:+ start:1326 stop:2603 length:1278 start_codon:yes stop_codon:yes gene_type:complete
VRDFGVKSSDSQLNGIVLDSKNRHLYFDEATITVYAGQGGDGEAWDSAKPKVVKNFKYRWGRNIKKYVELPAAEPADGGRGGSVYIRVNRTCDSLLCFHEQNVWRAKKGYHGSASPNAAPGRERRRVAPEQHDLFIDVPPGTVVRRKRNGELLGDLTQHGMSVLIAEGGAGGLAARRCNRSQIHSHKVRKTDVGLEVSDIDLQEATTTSSTGEQGEAVTVELLMRVVADIGIVGLPNAGKSSILKALTRASPTIANYPFTTLMPNLGVIKPQTANHYCRKADLTINGEDECRPVLADLPGLIEGAHKGRGLGRAFLRHLRRTRALLVVIDGSGKDPVGDYTIIREELRLYNPEYIRRPHILALNKMDTEWAAVRLKDMIADIKALDANVVGCKPVAFVPVSAATGSGIDVLMKAANNLMQQRMHE